MLKRFESINIYRDAPSTPTTLPHLSAALTLFTYASVAVMAYLYIGGVEGFGCFTHEHSPGCMDITSEDDCSMLMAVSCSTETGVPEGATCDYVSGGGGWMRLGVEPVSDEASCLNFFETAPNDGQDDGVFCPLEECCGTLKNVRICYELSTSIPLIISYAGALHAVCMLIYSTISKRYLVSSVEVAQIHDKTDEGEVEKAKAADFARVEEEGEGSPGSTWKELTV